MEEQNKLILRRQNSLTTSAASRRREMLKKLCTQRLSDPGGSGLLGGGDTTSPTRLMGIRLQQAVLGTTIPIIIGQQRVAWKIGWYGDFLSWPEGGSGLIKGGGNYAYAASLLGIVCLGPTQNFLGIWVAGYGKAMVAAAPTETYQITGSGYVTYVPNLAEIFIQDAGVGIASNYSVEVYDYGSGQYITISGTQQVPLIYTASQTPPKGYYSTTTGPFTTWNSGTNYVIGNLTTFSGVNYVAIAPNSNKQPPNATYWALAPIVYIFNAADEATGTGVATINYQVFYANFLQTQLGVVPYVPGPYVITVDFANEWPKNSGSQGWGVQVAYYPSGNPFTIVSSAPTAVGQCFPNYGNFTFYSGDAGASVVIQYTYTDSSLYASAGNHGVPNRVNYTFFSGELGQAPWIFTYQNPPGEVSSQTFTEQTPPIAYSEVAYVGAEFLYLGFSPQVPQLNFEIAGSYAFGNGVLDANPADAIYGCLTNPTYKLYFPGQYIDGSLLTGNSSAKNFWAANNFFISAVLDSQSSLMSIIGDWCEAGQCWVSWDEGRMKFIPLGDTSAVANGVQYTPPTGNAADVTLPVIDLDDNDFVVEKNKDPITIEQSPWQSRWNRVNVRWNVRINDYNEDCLQVSDEASIQQYGLMQEAAKSWSFLCTQTATLFAANMRLQRFQSIFTTYKFTLKSNFAFLSPGDIVTVTDGLLGSQGTMFGRTPVRITKMTDDPKKGIDIEAETFPWSVGTAILYNIQAQIPSNTNQGPNANPGDTTAVIFEVPNEAAQYNGDELYIFCNGENTNWGGFQMWVSSDGVTYNPYGTYQNQGRIGTLVNPLPYCTDPDYVNNCTVDMIEGGAQLQSVSQQAWNNYVSLSAIVSPNVSSAWLEVAGTGTSVGSGGGGGVPGSQGPNTPTVAQNWYGPNLPQWNNPNGIKGSLSYANTTVNTTAYSVTSVNVSGLYSTYNGTFPGGGGNALAGLLLTAFQFSHPVNNGFNGYIVSSSTTQVTVLRIATQGPGLNDTSGIIYANIGAGYSFATFLMGMGLGFTIPTQGIGAIIGIQVTCTLYGSSNIYSSPYANPFSCQLIFKNSGYGGEIGYYAVTTTPTVYTFGSLTSLSPWYLAPGSVSANVVNDSSFGVILQAVVPDNGTSSSTETFYVQNVQVEIAWAPGGAANVWANTSSVSVSTSYAYCLLSSYPVTQWLSCTNFNFTIPFGFTVTGIQVSVNAYSGAYPATITAWLIYNQFQIGNPKGITITNASSPYNFVPTQSEQSDLWGANAGYWNYQLLNQQGSSGFGVVFQGTGSEGDTIYINDVQVTIYGYGPYALELIAYETAQLVDPYTYQLTTLHRGILGSVPYSHPTGATFARLDQATITYQVPAQYLGTTLYFKFLSFNSYGNQLQSLANVTAVAVPIQGLGPGAIDEQTGALLTGVGVVNVNGQNQVAHPASEMALAFSTLKGSFGLQNIPSGYALIGPQGTQSGVPQWQNVQGGAGGGINDMYIYIPPVSGLYGANQELYFAIPVRNITIAANLFGSNAGCRVAPTSNVTVQLLQNGSSIGSVNFAAGSTTATFTFTNAITWNGFSDTFQILAPSTVDKTFAGFWFDIMASRAN